VNTNTIHGHLEVFRRCKSDHSCIKTGFYKHPAVLAWVGHITGLCDYTNKCIDEWVHRGYTNYMRKYAVRNISYPWWASCPAIHMSHRAALMRKELLRKETPWYVNIRWINGVKTTPWYTRGYIWVAKLSAEQIELLKTKKRLTPADIQDVTSEPTDRVT